MNRENLREILTAFCERLGYDGYIEDVVEDFLSELEDGGALDHYDSGSEE